MLLKKKRNFMVSIKLKERFYARGMFGKYVMLCGEKKDFSRRIF